MQNKVKEIELSWKENRPQSASLSPAEASPQIKNATEQLILMGTEIEQTIKKLDHVCKAKELLNLELSDANCLDNLQEDHRNLLDVWQAIAVIWRDIDKIDKTPFQLHVQKAVKETLDQRSQDMREFPNRMRGYQIYEAYVQQLSNYKAVNNIFADLRNDAMKPKHLKDLAARLKI